MPDRQAIRNGVEYERDLARETGGHAQANSGAGPHQKLDVASRGLLWSAKTATTRSGRPAETFMLTSALVQEMVDGAKGTGRLPVLAVSVAGISDDLVVMRKSDLLSVLESPADFSVPLSRGEQRAARASVPSMLRD